MKKTTTFLIGCLLLVLNTIQAQNKCCSPGTVIPELTPGLHSTLVPLNQNTPPISLSVSASNDLPNVEYLITKRGTPALNSLGTPDTTGGGGDVIIGADLDGVFIPMDKSRYGVTLAVGDTFDLTAIGYDLALMENLIDSLLNGYSPGSGPCCSLFVAIASALGEPSIAGFCDTMHNAGIYSSNDINDFEDILTFLDLFLNTDPQLSTSIPSVISIFQILNANGTYIGTDCGGTGTNNFMPYGINKNKKYGYVIDNPLTVQQLSDVSLFLMYPNPSTVGDVYVYFTTIKQVDLNINVYNALGQRVHSETLGNVSGDFNTQIPTGNLAAGMYFVELTDGHNSQIHKLQVK